MLLTEILDKPSPKIKQVDRPTHTKNMHNPKLKLAGTGYQTVTYLKNKFPDKVVKWAQVTGTNDPVYQFIRLCLNNKNNPYLPKIYTAKYYTNPNKEISNTRFDSERLDDESYQIMSDTHKGVLIYVMEKLKPLSRDHITDVEQYGITEDMKRYIIDSVNFAKINMHPSFYFTLGLELPKIRKIMMQNAKDPNFRKVLRAIEPLIANFRADTHHGNFMVRDDGHIVFVDPISYKD